MEDGRQVTINGKRWTWRWHRFGRARVDATCDGPEESYKEIRVRSSLNRPEEEHRLMEVAIHEALHALAWPLEHAVVTNGAKDIADLLWELGYRRVEEQ